MWWRRWALLLMAVFLLSSCDDDSGGSEDTTSLDDLSGDTQTQDATDLLEADYSEHFIEGGGTTGGPLEGLLVVWIFDQESEAPLSDAHLMVEVGDQTFMLDTDGEGKAVFTNVSGPVSLHFAAEDYRPGSVFGLDASFLTIGVEKVQNLPPEAKETTTISGEVTGFDLLPTPPLDQSQARFAFVMHGLPSALTMEDDYPALPQAARQGMDMPQNVVAPLVTGPGYSLDIYQHPGALFALAGMIELATQKLTLTHIGVALGVDGANPSVSVALSAPVDQSSTVSVSDPSGSFEVHQLTLLADFGDEGVVYLHGGVASDPIQHIDFGAAPFDAANATLLVQGGQEVEEGAPPSSSYPKSTVVLREVQGSLPGEMDVTLLQPPSPSWESQSIQLGLPAAAGLATLSLRDQDGEEVWGAFVFDTSLETIALPSFPAEWGEELALGDVVVTAMDTDLDPNEVVFDTLGDELNKISEGFASP